MKPKPIEWINAKDWSKLISDAIDRVPVSTGVLRLSAYGTYATSGTYATMVHEDLRSMKPQKGEAMFLVGVNVKAGEWEFQNTNGSHRKFYRMKLRANGASWLVTCQWGRLGTFGQEQDHHFDGRHEAQQFVEGKGVEKLSKGYVQTLHQDIVGAGDPVRAEQLEAAGVKVIDKRAARPKPSPPAEPHDPTRRRFAFDE